MHSQESLGIWQVDQNPSGYREVVLMTVSIQDFSLRSLGVLCASVVNVLKGKSTAEAQNAENTQS